MYYQNYYLSNREEIILKTFMYQQNNPEQCRYYSQQYRLRNLEYTRLKNRLFTHVWRIRNSNKSALYSRVRRATEVSAKGSYNIQDIENHFIEQMGRCVYCGIKFKEDNFQPK